MTSRERLKATLNHRTPDGVCMDLGSTAVTGIHISALHRLRQAVLGQPDYRVKLVEPYQMLGEVDAELRQALGVDVVGIGGSRTLFGFAYENWKPFTLFDGTEVLVPGGFNVTRNDAGDLLLYPEGDTSVPASGRMPNGGYFFDSIVRQPPIDEDRLDPADNLEEFAPLSEAELAHFDAQAAQQAATGCGAIISTPGTGFGDIALVPGPWMKHPRGIRDIEEWYVSTIARRGYVMKVFERQCEIALGNIERLAKVVGDRADVAFVSGTDFGTQRGLFISPQAYRELYKPFHVAVNRQIHRLTGWKTFIHSCGSVVELLGEFIDAGFDVLNPVQCSAAGMDEKTLKRNFGKSLVFWGGAVDTQHTLPFGTPDEVYRQVRQRIDVFNVDGGFVLNPIHNVQSGTPVQNMLAMFRAVRDSRA